MRQALTIFSLLVTLNALSQHEDDKKFNSLETFIIKLTYPEEKPDLPLSFSHIKVFDCRPDTSTIGLLDNNKNVCFLKTQKPLSEEIESFYSKMMGGYKSVDTISDLYCFIKKFVLSDFISVAPDEKEKEKATGKIDWVEKSGLKIKLEFFIKINNDFIPAYRYDSVLVGLKNVKNKGADYMYDALLRSIKKATTVSWDKIIAKGKKLTWEDIQRYNQRAITYPVLNDKQLKGVFLTFEDFRNNKTVYPDLTVRYESKGDFLYIKDKSGRETLVLDLWGYSDGLNTFLYSANNFFKLHRIGNSLIFYGAKDYSKNRVLRLNFGLIDVVDPNSNLSKGRTRAKYDLVKSFLQLDLDNGEIY